MSSTSKQMWKRPGPFSPIHLVTPGLRALALQQLDVGLAHRQHGEARLADLLLVLEGQAEGVLQEVDGLAERLHRDRDVLHALDLHRALRVKAGMTSAANHSSCSSISDSGAPMGWLTDTRSSPGYSSSRRMSVSMICAGGPQR